MNSKNIVKDLLESQRYAVIATKKGDAPYINLVAFSCSKDYKKIFFSTSKNSNKYNNLIENPNISMLIDNRINDSNDVENASAITIFGKAYEIKKDINPIKNLHLQKHPNLSVFFKKSDNAIISINIEKLILVENFDRLTEISL